MAQVLLAKICSQDAGFRETPGEADFLLRVGVRGAHLRSPARSLLCGAVVEASQVPSEHLYWENSQLLSADSSSNGWVAV